MYVFLQTDNPYNRQKTEHGDKLSKITPLLNKSLQDKHTSPVLLIPHDKVTNKYQPGR